MVNRLLGVLKSPLSADVRTFPDTLIGMLQGHRDGPGKEVPRFGLTGD